jgi:catechol 2,3-dioxygenase-like lactoylglutathione lyase family enzyme
MTMFTYACLGSSDLRRSAAFYDPVLACLGLSRCRPKDQRGNDWEGWLGWGHYADDGLSELALWVCSPLDGRVASAGNGTMLAFRAGSWAQVDGFHAAATAHGGCSEGEPGLRAHYNPDFYAAYVRDPNGNKLAAVCRGRTERRS